jgi:phage-related protein
MGAPRRPIEFLGSSLSALRNFPSDARRLAGFQLDRVQRGLDPLDWKPLLSVGPGVREIRVRERSGSFRVLYAAGISTSGAVVVLHCFRKATRRTSRPDLDIARSRYRALMRTRQ